MLQGQILIPPPTLDSREERGWADSPIGRPRMCWGEGRANRKRRVSGLMTCREAELLDHRTPHLIVTLMSPAHTNGVEEGGQVHVQWASALIGPERAT